MYTSDFLLMYESFFLDSFVLFQWGNVLCPHALLCVVEGAG
jgi:hypothetical protein